LKDLNDKDGSSRNAPERISTLVVKMNVIIFYIVEVEE